MIASWSCSVFAQLVLLGLASDYGSTELRETVAGQSQSGSNLTEPDCGPRCLAIVLSLLGKQSSWQQLRGCFTIQERGVSMADLRAVASQVDCPLLGVRAVGSQMRQLAFPAIGQLEPSTQLANNHFVVVLNVENERVHFLDPSREVVESVSVDQFLEIATGNYLIPVRKKEIAPLLVSLGCLAIVFSTVLLVFRRGSSASGTSAAALALLLCLGCGSQSEPPPPKHSLLMTEPDRVDLGVLFATSDTTAQFTVKNVSPRALKVAILSKSCGCLESTLSKEMLEPNESAQCTVEFRLRNRSPGLFAESATIGVPEFHERHELHCAGFVQGAIISGRATTVISNADSETKGRVAVEVYVADRNSKVLAETAEITIPGVTPRLTDTVIHPVEKLALGGFRRRIEIPLSFERPRMSGVGIVSVTIVIDGKSQQINGDLNLISE